MPFENVESITLVATGAIPQRRFVTINTSGRAARSAAGDDAVGIALDSASTNGDVIPVAQLDGSRMEIEAGAAVANGSLIASDATGRAIVATSGNPILGRAVVAASAAGEIIDIITARGAREV